MRVIADTGGAAGAWPRWRADHTHLAETAIKHIDDILASRPFDLARLAVAQGTLADLAGQ